MAWYTSRNRIARCPEAGIPIEWVAVSGLRGKGLASLLLAPFKLLYALSQSLYVMCKHRPAAVLGMGGFVSGPGGLAAWLTRRPLRHSRTKCYFRINKPSSGASCPGCAAGLPGQF